MYDAVQMGPRVKPEDDEEAEKSGFTLELDSPASLLVLKLRHIESALESELECIYGSENIFFISN